MGRSKEEIAVYNCCTTKRITWDEYGGYIMEASKKYPFENIIM